MTKYAAILLLSFYGLLILLHKFDKTPDSYYINGLLTHALVADSKSNYEYSELINNNHIEFQRNINSDGSCVHGPSCTFGNIYGIAGLSETYDKMCSRWLLEECLTAGVSHEILEQDQLFLAVKDILSRPCDFLEDNGSDKKKKKDIKRLSHAFGCGGYKTHSIVFSLYDENMQPLVTYKLGKKTWHQ